MNKPTICDECKHCGNGYPRSEGPRTRDQPPARIMSTRICLAQPHTHGTIDPMSGHRSKPTGVPCDTINRGECPDFSRALHELDAQGVFAALVVALVMSLLVWLATT